MIKRRYQGKYPNRIRECWMHRMGHAIVKTNGNKVYEVRATENNYTTPKLGQDIATLVVHQLDDDFSYVDFPGHQPIRS